MLNEHTGYALVQQSLVMIETELCMCTREVTMGMHTDGCLSIWQPCEYCPVLSNDVVYSMMCYGRDLEAVRGVGVLWQGACACQHSYLV